MMLMSSWSNLFIALIEELRIEEFNWEPIPSWNELFIDNGYIYDWLLNNDILELTIFLAASIYLLTATSLSRIFLSMSSNVSYL